jgi:hypothetical protein
MSEISVGGKVRLIAIPPYLKTANPMPMLRPSELLSIDDIGTVIDLPIEASCKFLYIRGRDNNC